MELFKFSSVEEKALNKLALPTRKLAVDRLRQYFALLFHPDITGLTDSPLARINADLDDLENGKYKSPSNNETESRNISDANEKITQYKKLVSQLQAKLKEKQDFIDKVILGTNPNDYRRNQIILSTLKCLRCGHDWIPRRRAAPKVCPNCKSPYWNKTKWKDVK
jgi:predicted Zn-ribbon and HTH transcriptional regulator